MLRFPEIAGFWPIQPTLRPWLATQLWEEWILTVADMNRLEQAARVSMSGFQDPDASASPAPHAWHPLLRFAAVALVAAIVLIVASQLG